MKAVVTGCAGFIGGSIAVELLRRGVEVIGIDSLTDYYDAALKEANLDRIIDEMPVGGSFDLVRGDLNNIDIDPLLEEVKWVFHQAGQPGVRASWGDTFDDYTRNNVNATQRLLEAATRASELERLVYASSSSIYGNAERYPTSENDLPQPVSPYGVTKLAAEHLVSLYANNFNVPSVSLRYFTVYGPRQRPDMAFTRFCRAAVEGESISLYGDGSQIRDFTYIDDVVAANILAATTQTLKKGAVFNIAGGSQTSMRQVIGMIGELSGSPLRVERLSTVPGDAKRTGGASQSFKESTGWEPLVAIEDGLRRQFEWVSAHH